VKDDRLDMGDVLSMNWDEGDVDKYALKPGDILVSEGQSPERVGQSAIYHGGVPGLCFQATLHRFRPRPVGPSARFAQLVFRSHVRTGVFRGTASITTNIAHLTLEKFKAAPFPLPPEAEQQRIVDEAEKLLSAAEKVRDQVDVQLQRSKALRASILHAAFSGRLASSPASDQTEAGQAPKLSVGGHRGDSAGKGSRR
jgi:type I restriction enzyme S subunit